MALLELALESGEELVVSRFEVREEISEPFDIWIQATSKKPDIDAIGILDRPMGFMLNWQREGSDVAAPRIWTGLCSHFQLIHAEPTGLSSYLLRLVPEVWRLQQRVNHRIFKQKKVGDIIKLLLGDWAISSFEWKATAPDPVREYTVQYGESDYSFMCRLLESVGVAYVYLDSGAPEWPCTDERSILSFSDALEKSSVVHAAIPFADNPNLAGGQDCLTRVRIAAEARPTRYVATDYAFQKPDYKLSAQAMVEGTAAGGQHPLYEHYHYEPGGLHEGRGPSVTLNQGIDATLYLQAERAGAQEVSFETNATDLAPGAVFTVSNHPLLSSSQRLLSTCLMMQGAPNEQWHLSGTAVFDSVPLRPRQITPKPRIYGVQSAMVVAGNQPTDEFGRICIKFPWDRDEIGSCWVRVSQAAASKGFGMYACPEPDDEVLVGFIEGDPDQPIVVGRVYNATHVHPYALPDYHTRGTWRGAKGNEITFEDKEGSEFVYLHATKDLLEETVNDRQTTVAHDSKESIGNNRHLLVGADDMTKVTGSVSLVVGKDCQLKVTGKHAVQATGEIHLKSATKIVLEGSTEITLKAPGGFVKIDSMGVTIKGNLVQINCPGPPAGSGGGSSPTEPEEPSIEFDGKPG